MQRHAWHFIFSLSCVLSKRQLIGQAEMQRRTLTCQRYTLLIYHHNKQG